MEILNFDLKIVIIWWLNSCDTYNSEGFFHMDNINNVSLTELIPSGSKEDRSYISTTYRMPASSNYFIRFGKQSVCREAESRCRFIQQ